jgi:hypothetical protein
LILPRHKDAEKFCQREALACEWSRTVSRCPGFEDAEY